jgi:bifunctional UDP-N-acetylglucosamine pyrophosphorylase/glucosamine-1-phosphate N-acetyltransferase
MNIVPIDWKNQEHYRQAAPPGAWTVVIAAAGKGTRLGFDKPKILFPVAGRTILDWLLDRFTPVIEHVVLVLSPSGESVVAEAARPRLGQRLRVAIQEEPTGMGDAVGIGLAQVTTPHVAVVWGDQVALRAESVAAVTGVHTGPLRAAVTCPTYWRERPYIHFERNETGQIERVLQAREGDAMPERGESDAGFFCFESRALRELLGQLRDLPEGRGASTGEFNLLPAIALAARQGRAVLTPQLVTMAETVGINSVADAAYLERLWAGQG